MRVAPPEAWVGCRGGRPGRPERRAAASRRRRCAARSASSPAPGSGKTTTITRRIAHQVATGAFAPSPDPRRHVHRQGRPAVMRRGSGSSAVSGVVARTFHSAALAQLHHFAPEAVGRILPIEGARRSGRSRTGCRRRTSSGRRATSRPRSSGRRRSGSAPESYRRELGEHEPPIPADLMATGVPRVRAPEGGTRRDRLRGPARARDPAARGTTTRCAATFRDRYRAFTVDEYQDVNLLQQTLLELWLGDRDDLCVVGDDYQSIYGFTGASPRWLVGVRASATRTRRSCGSSATTARRRRCSSWRTGSCRCSSGAEKTLRATREAGARARRPAASRAPEAEDAWLAGEVERLAARGNAARARWRCSRARTRAWPTSRRRSTTPASPSRARRCSSATQPGGC